MFCYIPYLYSGILMILLPVIISEYYIYFTFLTYRVQLRGIVQNLRAILTPLTPNDL
jgi:hypothetical protein